MTVNVTQSSYDVEAAWNSTQRQLQPLSILVSAGAATCSDVQQYNLLTIAAYNFRKAALQILRDTVGSTKVKPPADPPAPVLVKWKNVAASKTLQIDFCSSTAAMQGLQGNGLGDYFISANDVEFVVATDMSPETPPAITALVQQAKTEAETQGIGDPVTISLWVIGLVILITAAAAIAIGKLYSDQGAREEQTKQMRIQAEQHEATLTARANCIAAGGSPSDCAKANPGFDPSNPFAMGGWGFWGLIGLTAAAAVGGIFLYQRRQRLHGGGGEDYAPTPHRARHLLPAGSRVIDAEFEPA